MRLVHGVSLSRLLMNGPLEAGAVLALARQLASALAAAHAANVTHGHLSSDSVIVSGATPSPRAVITGFGEHEAGEGAAALPGELGPPPARRQRDLHDFGRLLLEMLSTPRAASSAVDPPLSMIAQRCCNPDEDGYFSAEQLELALAHARATLA